MTNVREPALALAIASLLAGCASAPRGGPTGDARPGGGTDSGTFLVDIGPLGDGAAPLWQDVTPAGLSLDFSNPANNYGTQVIQVSPANPSVVYFGTCYQGIWKSTDSGDHFTKVNTGTNGPNLDTGRNWGMALDPTDPNTLYTVAGAGSGQGIWKSSDGGVDWSQVEPDVDIGTLSADVYDVVVDPYSHLHVLATFHTPWMGLGDAGFLESSDGGSTWKTHMPISGWGAGHWIFFLDNSSTWLLMTQGDGYWRTADAGTTWTQVTTQSMQHGGGGVYRARTGVLYAGAVNTLLRSTDDGLTWTSVGPCTPDGYNAVIGDGVYLYAQPANTGGAASGQHTYFVSLETDGVTWRPYDMQLFGDGPMSMSFDPVHRILFSSNWDTGIWRLKVSP